MISESLPDFSGKLVLLDVHPVPGNEGDVLLESAVFENQGGRLFVVGRVPSLPDWEWLAEVLYAVAWDSVCSYQIFESLDDYKKRLTHYRPTLRERIFG